MRVRRVRWRRTAAEALTGALLVGVAAGSTLLGGCTSVHNGLGTRDSSCFRVLPAARQVVGSAPTFGGVRDVAPALFVTALDLPPEPRRPVPSSLRQPALRSTCLVEFHGSFDPRSKAFVRAWHPGPGPYRFAIVVVGQQDLRVVAVVLLARPPLRFGRLYA
jgi:hypothetical protein